MSARIRSDEGVPEPGRGTHWALRDARSAVHEGRLLGSGHGEGGTHRETVPVESDGGGWHIVQDVYENLVADAHLEGD